MVLARSAVRCSFLFALYSIDLLLILSVPNVYFEKRISLRRRREWKRYKGESKLEMFSDHYEEQRSILDLCLQSLESIFLEAVLHGCCK